MVGCALLCVVVCVFAVCCSLSADVCLSFVVAVCCMLLMLLLFVVCCGFGSLWVCVVAVVCCSLLCGVT